MLKGNRRSILMMMDPYEATLILTVWGHDGDGLITLDGVSEADAVGGSDAEHVLVSGDESGHVVLAHAGLHLGHVAPAVGSGVALLDEVAGEASAAIVRGRLPLQRQRVPPHRSVAQRRRRRWGH